MGGEGTQASDITTQGGGLQGLQQGRAGILGKSGVAQALAQYGQGGMSIEDALSQAKAGGLGQADTGALEHEISMLSQLGAKHGLETDQQQHLQNMQQQLASKQAGAAGEQGGFMHALATDPLSGTRFAEDQVRGSKLAQPLLGEGGLQERLGAEEQQLAGQGYKLTPEDREAYAQASGDITRQYGRQEQNVAQQLAARGMSGAPAAQAAFTGMAGSKMEQLGKLQSNIADQRMQRNQQRLAQTRQQMMQTGQLGQQALQSQFGRQMAGRAAAEGGISEAAQMAMAQKQMQQGQLNQQFQQQQDTKGPGLGGVLGTIAGGVGGALLGGPAGAKLGSSLGGALGGLGGGGGQQGGPSLESQVGGRLEQDIMRNKIQKYR